MSALLKGTTALVALLMLIPMITFTDEAVAPAGGGGTGEVAASGADGWTGGAGLSAGTPDMRLLFLEGSFDPLEDGDTPSTAASEGGLYLIQFSGLIRESDKRALEDMGVWFFEYMPYNAFSVWMDDKTAIRVKHLDGIRWVGAFPVGTRTSPWMEEGLAVQEGSIMDAAGLRTLDVQVLDSRAGWTARRADRSAALEETAEALSWAQTDVASIFASHGGALLEVRDDILRFVVDPGEITGGTLLDDLEDCPFIGWVEPAPVFVLHNDIADGIINVEAEWDTYGLQGHGQIVAVADTGIDTGVDDPTETDMHLDFDNRTVAILNYAGTSADDGYGHGTHVAGSVLGNGNASGGQIKGMAPNASLVFQGIATDADTLQVPAFSTLFGNAYSQGARIHTNSWGSTVWGVYTSNSRSLDLYMWNNPDFLVLFSAGNDGTDGNSDGKVDPDSIGSPATAKNCITVGASENLRPSFTMTWGSGWGADFPANPVNSDRTANNTMGLAGFSSRGPTDDGRLKPDIVAPGTYILSTRSSVGAISGWGNLNATYQYMGGTSMSCPITAGAAAIVRQHYTDEEGIYPSAALIKATMTNGALDMTPGQYGGGATQEIGFRPDNDQGWGLVNVSGSIHPEGGRVKQYEDNNTGLTAGNSVEYVYGVAGSSENLTFTLVWTDYPGSTGGGIKLVNNLNLKVTGPGGEEFYGNDFTAPYNDTLDGLNTVEMVFVPSPGVGIWTVNITAPTVPNGPQPFALVVSGALTDSVGLVQLDRTKYDVISKVNVTLSDGDLKSTGSQVLTVTSNRDPAGVAVTLTETPADSGIFLGSVTLTPDTPAGSKLLVFGRDRVMVNYTDAFPAATRSATAQVSDWAPMDPETAVWPYGNALNITWNASVMPRLSGYRIYRDTTAGGPYELEAKLGVTDSYDDTGLKDGTTYYYVMTAIDASGGESHATDEFNGTPQDSIGPPVWIDAPESDTILGGVYEVEFNSSHADVKNVTLQCYNDSDGNGQADDGSSWELLGYHEDLDVPFQWDTTLLPPADEHLILRARGRDEAGNYGLWSQKVINVTIDNSPPEKPDLDNKDLYPSIDELDEVTNLTSITVSGSVKQYGGLLPEFDATVHVMVSGAKKAQDTTDVNGSFSALTDLTGDGVDGYRNITVKAWDRFDNGPVESPVHVVVLDTTKPKARAGDDTKVNLTDAGKGVNVTLNGSASSDPVDTLASANRIINWTWTFTDLSPKTYYGPIAGHAFREVGAHDVKLTVYDRAGNKGSDKLIVTVNDAVDPVANAGDDFTVDQDHIATFNATGSYDNHAAGIVNYTWTFDDPNARASVDIFSSKPIYIFHVPGVYQVTLTVFDISNNTDTDGVTVRVNDTEAPEAHAGKDFTVHKGEEFAFNGTLTSDNNPDFPDGAEFRWEFGDEGDVVLPGMTPKYAFTNTGLHPAVLKVTDEAGNTGEDTVVVTVLADVTGPSVEEVFPAQDATDVALDTLVWVLFTEPVTAAGAATGMTVAPAEGGAVDGTAELDTARTKLTFTPSGDLREGSTYTVSLDPASYLDAASNALEGVSSWRFTTAEGVLDQYLDVTGTTPADGEVNVSLDVTVRVTLSDVLTANLTDGAFTLVYGDGDPVDGELNASGDAISFTPNEPLAHLTNYTATLSRQFQGPGGLTLQEDLTFGFRTVAVGDDTGDRPDDGKDDGSEFMGLQESQCLLLLLVAILLIVVIVAAVVIQYRKSQQVSKEEQAWQGGPGDEELEWEEGSWDQESGGRGPDWQYRDVEYQDMPAAGGAGAMRRSRQGPRRGAPGREGRGDRGGMRGPGDRGRGPEERGRGPGDRRKGSGRRTGAGRAGMSGSAAGAAAGRRKKGAKRKGKEGRGKRKGGKGKKRRPEKVEEPEFEPDEDITFEPEPEERSMGIAGYDDDEEFDDEFVADGEEEEFEADSDEEEFEVEDDDEDEEEGEEEEFTVEEEDEDEEEDEPEVEEEDDEDDEVEDGEEEDEDDVFDFGDKDKGGDDDEEWDEDDGVEFVVDEDDE